MQLPDEIRVDDLVLRPPTSRDRSDVVALLSQSDEIPRWTRIPFPYSNSDYDAWLELDHTRYLISRGNTILGSVGARVDVESVTAEIGYWLAAGARGQGVMTRSCEAVSAALFGAGIERIEATVTVGNEPSSAVLERSGFTLEGIKRSVWEPRCGLDGSRMDMEIWSLLPGELSR